MLAIIFNSVHQAIPHKPLNGETLRFLHKKFKPDVLKMSCYTSWEHVSMFASSLLSFTTIIPANESVCEAQSPLEAKSAPHLSTVPENTNMI